LSLLKSGRLATKVNSLLPSPYPSDVSSHNHIAEFVPSPAIKKTSLPVPLTESVYLIEEIRSLLKVLDIKLEVSSVKLNKYGSLLFPPTLDVDEVPSPVEELVGLILKFMT
jgi:hypothetical protein